MCRSTLLLLLAGALASLAHATDETRRDPTKPERWVPRMTTSVPFERPVLSSVLVSAGRRLAVIDGQLLGVGESHGSFRVRSIEAERVVVNVAGEAVVLHLDVPAMSKELR